MTNSPVINPSLIPPPLHSSLGKYQAQRFVLFGPFIRSADPSGACKTTQPSCLQRFLYSFAVRKIPWKTPGRHQIIRIKCFFVWVSFVASAPNAVSVVRSASRRLGSCQLESLRSQQELISDLPPPSVHSTRAVQCATVAAYFWGTHWKLLQETTSSARAHTHTPARTPARTPAHTRTSKRVTQRLMRAHGCVCLNNMRTRCRINFSSRRSAAQWQMERERERLAEKGNEMRNGLNEHEDRERVTSAWSNGKGCRVIILEQCVANVVSLN